MTIECINNESRFFQDVKTLGKRNSATLGFMPEGGFEDHAQNQRIFPEYLQTCPTLQP